MISSRCVHIIDWSACSDWKRHQSRSGSRSLHVNPRGSQRAEDVERACRGTQAERGSPSGAADKAPIQHQHEQLAMNKAGAEPERQAGKQEQSSFMSPHIWQT